MRDPGACAETGATVNTIRYVFALVMLIFIPSSILFWVIVHPFIGFWRRLGAAWTYGIVSAF